MAGVLADIYAAARIVLDTGQFITEAGKAGDAAGKTVSDKMSAQLNAKLKTAISGAVGAAAGLTFATAINGALKLNELAGEYQVQTGASAEEAKAFQGTLNDLFKTSHQGYDEIAQTLIGLKTHFDLTGQAAADAAANYLDFSEMAGGTGADAVERFNSLIKTGIIGIEDTKATMGDLLVAHQKLGIPINATIDGMIKLAPAMNAVGMSAKEGAALVGLFTKAGVSGDRMAQAFNTALTKIKSPAEFRTLINNIATAATDLDAAQIGAEYFGTRVGPAFANLLRSGGDALTGFNAILGDTTKAFDEAAYANDHTFGGQALLILHQFQGTLADVASSMGTTSDAILMAAALLGPGLTRALVTGVGGLAGLLAPKIAAQIMGTTVEVAAAGTVQGAATGAAIVAGEAGAVAAGGPAVAGGVAAQGAEVGVAATGLGTMAGAMFGAALLLAIPVAFAGGLNIATQQFKGMFTDQAQSNGMWSPWSSTPVGEQLKGQTDVQKGAEKTAAVVTETFEQSALDIKLLAAGIPQSIVDKLDAGGSTLEMGADGAFKVVPIALTDAESAAKAIAAGAPKHIADQIAAGKGTLSVAADGTFSVIPKAAAAAATETKTKISEALQGVIDAISSSRSALASAWSGALDAGTREIDIHAEEYQLRIKLIDPELQKLLKSQDATDRREGATQLANLKAQYAKLEAEDANYGTKAERILKLAGLLTSKALLDGLASTDEDVRDQWVQVNAVTQEKLDELTGIVGTNAWTIGSTFGDQLVAAIVAKFPAAQKAIWDLMSQVPTGNPWGSPGGGGSTMPPATPPAPVTTAPYTGGSAPYMPGRARGGPVEAGMPYRVNENTAHSEWFVPQTAGTIVPSGAMGGITNNNNVTVNATFGSDISPTDRRRLKQTVADAMADALQAEGSRFSGFTGSSS